MIVEVEPCLREYEPYMFWLLGTPLQGHSTSGAQTVLTRLGKTWWHMMQRCYAPEDSNYHLYGAEGVSVCKRWHQVANYVADVKLLHGWDSKLKDWAAYHLDKDYYASNQYSPSTCVWLSQADNSLYTRSAKPVRVTPIAGEPLIFLSLGTAALAYGVAQPTMSNWFTGKHPLPPSILRIEHFVPALPLRYALIGEQS